MEKIKVISVRVGEPPKVIEMENTLEAKQKFVGGWIEMICPIQHGDDTAVLIGNEEAKLLGMEPNAYLRFEDGRIYDVVCGDFFIVDAPIGSEDFASLSDKQIEKYMRMYG
jgi:hypothetical protein